MSILKLFIIIIVIVSIIYLLNNILLKNNRDIKLKSKCWIDTKLFPEAKYIFENRNIIKKELENILNSNLWVQWLSDYKEAPSFTKMSHDDITNRIMASQGNINSAEDGSWRLYPLILNQEILNQSADHCPETMKLLSKVSKRILNAGFSLLEPNSSTKPHVDYNNKFYRLHIPMIIPKNNQKLNNIILDKTCINKKLAVFQVEDEYRAWSNDNYFIFDDLCLHNAWNWTDENRIVLLIDLLKIEL